MKILLIRHGETDVNSCNSIHKTNDPRGLNNTGIKQAQKLIPVIIENEVSTIYSSPEKRALDTAKIITAENAIPVLIINDLRERNWGEWEKRSWDEISKLLDRMTIEQRYLFIPPGGESWEQMDFRLRRFINQITGSVKNSLAIITHEGALRALVTILNNASRESGLNLHFANASVSIFIYRYNKFIQLTSNITKHLI